MIVPFYKSEDKDFTLLKGDCVELLNSFDFKFDMIFADPPYHLSNGGISVQSGRMVSVNKGDWDKYDGTNGPTFNLFGGTLEGGKAGSNGGAVIASAFSNINLYGGEIKDSTATNRGGNVYINVNCNLNIYAGGITGGEAGLKSGDINFGNDIYILPILFRKNIKTYRSIKSYPPRLLLKTALL